MENEHTIRLRLSKRDELAVRAAAALDARDPVEWGSLILTKAARRRIETADEPPRRRGK